MMHPHPSLLLPVLIAVASSAAVLPAQLAWELHPVSRFEERVGFAAAAEPGTGRILIVGGGRVIPSRPAFADELSWEGGTFRWLDDPDLPALLDPAITLDTTRGELLLFGGSSSPRVATVFRVWNGTRWVDRGVAPGGPADRAGHLWVHDPVRGVCVLFGGRNRNDAKLGDTWIWDGTTWLQMASGGPAPRDLMAAAFDPTRGAIVMFGGDTDTGASSETWTLDASGWSLLTTSGPAPRFQARMAFDPVGGELLLNGGQSATQLSNDTWALPPGSTSWIRRNYGLGGSGYGHEMLTDPATGRLVTLGPADRSVAMTAHELTATGWREVVEPTPWQRSGHTLTLDERRDVLVLFGGSDRFRLFGGVHETRGEGWQRFEPASEPPLRREHAAAWDRTSGNLLVFGGLGQGPIALDDTWSWDGQSWNQLGLAGPAPSPRFKSAMAQDALGSLILFGGVESSTVPSLGDTWRWDGQQWSELAVTGPAGRGGHRMVYDPVRRVTVLHGGSIASSPSDETWLWDGHGWQLFPGPRGPATSGAPMAWDPRRQRVVLTMPAGTAWEWDGRAWRPASTDPSPVAGDLAMAPALSRLFAFGESTVSSDVGYATWVLDTDTPADAVTRFTPCGSITLRAEKLPVVGHDDCTLTVDGAPAGTPVFLGLDAVRGPAPPLDGCETALTLLFDIDLGVLAGPTDARFTFPIPALPALRGVEVAAMGFRLAQGGPVFGEFELTESLILTLGD